MNFSYKILSATESLCPECLERIPAYYADGGDGEILLIKACPEHGHFQVPVWRGPPYFGDWKRPKTPAAPRRAKASTVRGCPFDCGLCERHGQNTCCSLLEVTSRCSLSCPVCYASAGGDKKDPDREELGRLMDSLIRQSGICNLQLSGGEPTERDDIPEIVAMARLKGFTFIQLNTNGLRLGTEPGYAERLADAGLAAVYLQFDAVDDKALATLRGRACLAEKTAAARAATAAGLGVVLVMTAVPGVNTDQFGAVLRFALAEGAGVRGLHVQPAASFGRYPWESPAAERITLPEVMRALEEQSGGMLRARDFHPPGGEHALCSFSALYERTDAGGLRLVQNSGEGRCCCGGGNEPEPIPAEEGVRRAKAFTALHWRNHSQAAADDDFGRILRESGVERRFTVSAMAFQDVMTVDLERLRGCYIHVVGPDGGLAPFCSYNLTSLSGSALHRGVSTP